MKSFRLNQRKYDNKIVFYASFPTSDGGWSKRKSTECSTRSEAEKWCIKQLGNGMAMAMANGDTTLRQWCAGFWGTGGWYDRERQARGFKISHVYLENQRRALEKHILPVFGNSKLFKLRTAELDDFFLNLYDNSKLSGSTVNGIMKSIRVPLKVAVKRGYLDRSPMETVGQVFDGGYERGVLAQEEINRLFALESLDTVWGQDRVSMLLSMLAAGCGLRHGEALAVRPMDIQDDILSVTRQWDRGSRSFKDPKGSKNKKTKRIREVPIPRGLKEGIDSYITDNQIPPAGLLFADRVVHLKEDKETIKALRSALIKIGITLDDQGRENRFLDFHSLRHTFVTRLRVEGTPDWEIQAVAGHKSLKMTDIYTHGRGKDYKNVAGKTIIPFEKRA